MFIAIQNNNPIGGKSTGGDIVEITKSAEEWADYSRKNVHIIETNGVTATTHSIVMPRAR